MFQVQVQQTDGSWHLWTNAIDRFWAEAFKRLAQRRYHGQEVRIVQV